MEENKPNVNEGAKKPLGTENKKETMSFDELLKSNKDYQAEFDRRMTKAQTTATANAVNKAVEEARKLRYKKMKIGCLEGNPSNGFDLKMGGKLIGRR